MELFCPTLHLRSGDKKESFAIYINVGIRWSGIIKRNLIDSGLYVHERARCSHGKPDRRKRKCCREGHMHLGTGSVCLPSDTVTKTRLRVVFASRNNGTLQGTVLSGSRENSNKCTQRRQSCLFWRHEGINGSGGMFPLILNLGTRLEWSPSHWHALEEIKILSSFWASNSCFFNVLLAVHRDISV